MKKLTLLLLIILLQLVSIAQRSLLEYGKIDMADLQLKSCPFEPDAPAMKLFDQQKIEFEKNSGTYKLTTEKRVRIKIFNQRGYDYASIKIPYFYKKWYVKIKDLSAIIYTLDANGNVVTQELRKNDFYKEKVETNVNEINFTFPNLKDGCVIEYRYTKIEYDIAQIDPWILQDEIPTAYAVTSLLMPYHSSIKEKVFGSDTINQMADLLKSGANWEKRKIYYKENIRSFKPEPYMSSYNDNLLKMIFMLDPSGLAFTVKFLSAPAIWNQAAAGLLESPSFGEQIKQPIPGTETIIDSAKKIISVADRIDFIYKTVQNQITAKENQTFYANSVTDAWNNKSATSGESNMIFLNLLKKSNVLCYPLLVSTKKHGLIDTGFPSLSQFNGVDVLALDSNQIYIMDASVKHQSIHIPPFNILNRKAFLLDSSGMRWIFIADERPLSNNDITITCELSKDGIIKGDALVKNYNYAKLLALDTSYTEKEKTDGKFYNKKQQGFKILSSQKENIDNNELPLVEKINFSYELNHTGNFYFLNPQFLTEQDVNPFIKSERNSDIDFGCNQLITLQIRLKIPTGYSIEDLPKSVRLRSSDTTMLYSRTVFIDTASLVFRQSFEIKRSLFDKEEYAGIQQFFNKMFAMMAEEIVLKKTK